MFRTAITACVLAALAGCGGELPGADEEDRAANDMSNETAADDGPGEWIELFNGKNLDGWRSYNESAPRPGWIVEDGAIVLDAGEDTREVTGGDLITERQFSNFELELEWKIEPGGNSGIFFRVREFPDHGTAWRTGIEMQVLDDELHPDAAVPEHTAGACYGLYAPEGKRLAPVGEFNKVRLIVEDGHVEHWLNGRRIVEYVIDSEDWNERVAASKFADVEHFGRYREGHIGLQDHTDRVWYRNIRIREL